MEGDDKYSKLELVEVAYGDDEPQKSTDQTAGFFLQKYPDLKVICAPTTVGIAAAAKYLQDNGSSCKLTGLGLPSEMQEYTGDDDAHSCPYFYLWDMQGLGKLSAYATVSSDQRRHHRRYWMKHSQLVTLVITQSQKLMTAAQKSFLAQPSDSSTQKTSKRWLNCTNQIT